LEATSDEELLAALEEAREKYPQLTQTIDQHRQVISARSKLQIPQMEVDASEDEVARLIDQREPLIRRWEPRWDFDRFAGLVTRICDLGRRDDVELTPLFDEVRSLLTADPDRSKELVSTYLTEGRLAVPELPDEARGVLSFVLIHSLHPFMISFSSALIPLIRDEQWYQRVCPVCGGAPDLGYLEKEVGGLRLLCSRCDSVWMYKRGECTFCANSDKETFAYYLGDEEVYRLYVCDECKRYLKVVDGRPMSTRPLLRLQRILTVGMDISARQEGYR
jgi:FdhE protein